MSDNAYARIAERYQVPPSDDEAVERFFLFIAPMLSDEERAGIVAEVVAEEAAGAPVSVTTEVPVEVPTFSIDDAPPVAPQEMLVTMTSAEGVRESGLLHVDEEETVRDVVRRMAEAKAGMVAVCHQERLVGVFSEHDVVVRVVAKGLDPDDTSVASVMTRVN